MLRLLERANGGFVSQDLLVYEIWGKSAPENAVDRIPHIASCIGTKTGRPVVRAKNHCGYVAFRIGLVEGDVHAE